jgi:hypothetical protein
MDFFFAEEKNRPVCSFDPSVIARQTLSIASRF